MNEQEWADRFRDDLDVILMGDAPAGGASPEDYQEMLVLAQTFSELDMSEDSRVRHSLKHRLLSAPAPVRRRPSSAGENGMNADLKQSKRRTVVSVFAAAAALILVVAAVLTVPAVRASAAALFRFFVPGETNMNPGLQPTVTPPAQGAATGPGHPEALSGLSLEEVRQAVEQDAVFGYTVRAPGSLPAHMTFSDGIVDRFGRMAVLTYACEDRMSTLIVIMRGLAHPNPMVDPSTTYPVGSEAVIQAIDINGTPAEYVQGDFGLDGNWDSTLPVQTLSWEHAQVLYRLMSHTQTGSACTVTQDDLIATAASLLP